MKRRAGTALGPVVLVLLSLTGCGTAATQTTTTPHHPSSKAVSEAEAIRETPSKELAKIRREEAVQQQSAAPPKPALSAESSCNAFLHAPKAEQEAVAATRPGEVGQVAWGYYDTETACKNDKTTTVHFAICTAIEDIRQYPGLEAGAIAEYRQSYPWCFD